LKDFNSNENKNSLSLIEHGQNELYDTRSYRWNRSESNSRSDSESISSENHKQKEDDNGSEFGDDFLSQKEIYEKMPQIKKSIATQLKLDNEDILSDKLNLIRVSEGTILCREGDFNCGLFFIIDGQLYGTQKELNGDESTVFNCYSDQFCGNMSVISGEPSLFTIKAKCYTEIAMISKDNFHKIISYKPSVVLSVAHFIVKRMSAFVRQIDFALEWNLIESGDVLFRQDSKAENIYIVLNGRLRSIIKNENNKHLVGEFGRGDLVGNVFDLMIIIQLFISEANKYIFFLL
jgi:lysophospholipid hydrolase